MEHGLLRFVSLYRPVVSGLPGMLDTCSFRGTSVGALHYSRKQVALELREDKQEGTSRYA